MSAIDRREFLRVTGAAAAMLAAAGCSRAPREKIFPYVAQPPEATPGDALSFATAMTIDGYAIGLLAESHEGRPTKLRGNPDHPASLGATNAFAEASVLSLYDPDRARGVSHRGDPASWRAVRERLATMPDRGRGVHLVLEPTSSPTIADRVAALHARFPEIDVRWHAPLAPRNVWSGARLALGAPYEARLDVKRADVIVALDADFLDDGPASLVHARDFASRRKTRAPDEPMNRLYVAEPTPTATGLAADHRLRARGGELLALGAAIARELASAGVAIPDEAARALAPWAARASAHEAWARAAARDLASHRGRSLVLVGEPAAPELHALAHALNDALGNVGTTIAYAESPIVDAGSDAFDLAPLARALDAGEVDALVAIGGNPAYDAPADLDLARRMTKARFRAYVGPYANETAEACEWLVPQAHWLESWGDARAFDGTASLVQPLIAPLYDGRTAAEVLDAMLGEAPRTPHAILVARWRAARADAAIDAWLEKGIVPGTAIAVAARTAPRWSEVAAAIARLAPPSDRAQPSIEIAIRRDPRVRDGAFANNAWLQEMPATASPIVWDNAALLSRATASRLGVADGDVLHLEVEGRRVRAPARVTPGQADDTVAITLGYGRRGAESLARGVGFDAYALRTTDALWHAGGAIVATTGERRELARYQLHESLEGRDEHVALHRDLAEWRADRAFAAKHDKRKLTLYDVTRKPGDGQQWGMTIDLSACTGCGACTIACQAENNVPSVGRAGVAKGRAMHWLRIDRYELDAHDDPRALLQPMLCQHCEKAPCEYVCPVNATTHSEDGINQMVYNRCVGTRFCQNNCPYKVRRFNFFDNHHDEAAVVALVHNPDVTVRARGVIEKCTFCVQRVREAQIASRRDGVGMKDGDVATACEEACAARAIVFGDLSDPTSRVARERGNERAFACLDDLGTEPRVRYLARIRNPNPELGA